MYIHGNIHGVVRMLALLSAETGNALAWMEEFVGIIDTLPEDFAAEHDHYIYGTPKRAGR